MVEGYCDARFEAVRLALTEQLGSPDELGAAVSVILHGEVVVELWGGWTDQERSRPWQADTLVNAYSVGKPMAALLLLRLVDQGVVNLDQPVASYWPDFATNGKGGATVRHALCHQAGVPAIREPLTNDDLWDFDRMCAALAATEPWWAPGTRHAYHTNTYGHLIGGIVRQVTGDLPGTRLRAVCGELPDGAEVHFGLPYSEHARCADIHFDLHAGRRARAGEEGPPPPAEAEPTSNGADAQMVHLGYMNPPGYSSLGVVNTPEWRRAQVPSTNGHMTAGGIARVYQGLRAGDLLSKDLLAEAIRPQSTGHCPTLGQEITFGLGFQPWTPDRPLGNTPASFGHYGSGGALGFADPSVGLAFGYVTNHVVPGWQGRYNRALVDAVYSCI